MFSGKSEELIRRLRRAQIARQEVAIMKPVLDDRYDTARIVSHSQISIRSTAVGTARDILERAQMAQVVGIDEVQFLGAEVVEVCEHLAGQGKRVIVAGLDTDYRGRPFEPIPELLAIAEYITKTLAICTVCGGPANRSQRTTHEPDRIVVGGGEHYEARCRHCFVPPPEEAQDG
jgi:thymidine kinase